MQECIMIQINAIISLSFLLSLIPLDSLSFSLHMSWSALRSRLWPLLPDFTYSAFSYLRDLKVTLTHRSGKTLHTSRTSYHLLYA